jgi:hypothetical protein
LKTQLTASEEEDQRLASIKQEAMKQLLKIAQKMKEFYSRSRKDLAEAQGEAELARKGRETVGF